MKVFVFFLTFLLPSLAFACDSAELRAGVFWLCTQDPAPITGYLVAKTQFDQITQLAELWLRYGDRAVELASQNLELAQTNQQLLEALSAPKETPVLEYIGAGALGMAVGVALTLATLLLVP